MLIISSLMLGCSAKKAKSPEADIDLTDLDAIPIEDVESDSVVPLDTEVLAAEDSEQEDFVVEEVEIDGVFDNQDRFTENDETEELDEAEDEELVASSEISEGTSVDEDMIVEEVQTITKIIAKSEYQIQKNDTLMLISWKIYGDYSKWRELKALNENKVHSNGNIWTGETLVFNRPEVEFEWQPEGSPYLIQSGDTLGGISKSVYDESKHWQAIWYNNRDLIRNPDLIFAGFTIYYQELDQINQREIASKVRLFEKQK